MTHLSASLALALCFGTCATSLSIATHAGTPRWIIPLPIPGGGIRAEHLARHLSVLASDAFEGRAPTTEGERLTVEYISREFAEAGLSPGGDDGGWTQAVTLERSRIDGPVTARVHAGGVTRPLANGDDIAVESLHPGGGVDLTAAPLVFAG